MGPSGPMQMPDGMDATMPTNLANMVLRETKLVFLLVRGDLPPEGSTPFRKAIRPGMPEEAAAGWISTRRHAKRFMPREEPTQMSQAPVRSLSSSLYLVA